MSGNWIKRDYESGGQEFESLRARHVSLLFPERMLSWPSRLTHHNVGAIFYTVVPSGPLWRGRKEVRARGTPSLLDVVV